MYQPSNEMVNQFYMNISERIAKELGVKLNQVNAAVKLLDEGSPVPFIARYCKKATLAISH